MKQPIIIFIISALIGLAGGFSYFQFTDKSEPANAKQETTAVQKETATNAITASKETVSASTSSEEGKILKQKGCLSCHSVSKLSLQGGTTGPDLSNAYKEVEGKHGKPIEEFLKAPTSAVMSGVIKSNPLMDEERGAIIQALKTACIRMTMNFMKMSLFLTRVERQS
ncbi:cytochrome C [Bacillus methanolicus]|uniref:cytochrome C n=1 Tax=Bacillus methanolicus TaxID=1471 RepID=UPI0023804B48|nr:cytochrome C [Bacillus methanolicus]MDE3840942.1 cytochrome C [Bacillus methanolicus]